MSMHPKVEQALEEIDAAVMGGDTFEDEDDRKALLEYVERWKRELATVLEHDDDDDEPAGAAGWNMSERG